MKKGKPKGKATVPKKAAKKRSTRKLKDADLAGIRKKITNIVSSEAPGMAKAGVGEALKGELAPMKYLFEVAGLYPPAEGTEERPEQNSLARMLLDKLGLPEKKEVCEEDESWVSLEPAGSKAGQEDQGEDKVAEADESSGGDDPVSSETIP